MAPSTKTASERKTHRAGRVLLTILVILALLIVGLIYHRAVIEFFTRLTVSPQAYLLHVEELEFKDNQRLTRLLEGNGKKDASPKPVHMQDELTLTLSDTVQELLANVSVGPVKMNWIRSLGLSAQVNGEGDALGGTAELRLNDAHILDLQAAYDGETISLLLPELSEKVLAVPGALFAAAGDAQAAPALSKEEYDAMQRRYTTLAVGLLPSVERGTEALSAGGVTANCTTLTSRFSADEAEEILLALLREMQGDEALKNYLTELAPTIGQDPEKLLSSFDEAIAELETEGMPEGQYTVKVYVGASGRISGRFYAADLDEEDDIEMLIALPLRAGRLGTELRMDTGEESFALVGSGALRGLSVNGSYTVSMNGTELAVLEPGATLRNLHAGQAAVHVVPTRELLRMLQLPEGSDTLGRDLSLDGTFAWDKGLLLCGVELLQDTEALISLSAEQKTLAEGQAPALSDGISPEEWLGGIKMPNLLSSGSFGTIFDNLKAAGVPAELITAVKLLLPSLLK